MASVPDASSDTVFHLEHPGETDWQNENDELVEDESDEDDASLEAFDDDVHGQHDVEPTIDDLPIHDRSGVEPAIEDEPELEAAGDESDEDDYDYDWDVKEQLFGNLEQIQRSGKFYSFFQPDSSAPNPGLEIDGRGFGLPLHEHDALAIISKCHRAPYGKGTETIVNESYRKTWEIDATRIQLRHPAWPAELEKIVKTACDGMGIAGGTSAVEAQLYKLLVYEEGAMFKQHKESVPPCALCMSRANAI